MFKRYRFNFSIPSDQALAQLDAAVSANPGFGLTIEPGGGIKLFRNQGIALFTGFFPVFVGQMSEAKTGSELRGGFRFHLLLIGLFAGFVGVSIYSLLNIFMTPEIGAMLPDGLRTQRIQLELQFIAFAVIAAVFAWLAGKPIRHQIESIIQTSAALETHKH